MTEEKSSSIVKERKLTRRQRAFIDAYVLSLNATQAAITAGYSKDSATVLGHETLMKPYVRAEIDRILSLGHVSAEEAIAILDAHARSNIGELMNVEPNGEDFSFDLSDKERLRAVKSVTQRTNTSRGRDGSEFITKETRLELYDAQSAAEKILKLHNKFGGAQSEGSLVPVNVIRITINNNRETDSPEVLDA
jgi:phage terminase small subunit